MAGRVIVVDDVADIRHLIRQVIEELFAPLVGAGSLEVATAPDAATACTLCEGDPPAHVLMDVNLPGEDGISAFYRIKERSPELARRVYFLTGLVGSPDSLQRLHQAVLDGAGGVLVKPVTAADLQKTIETHLPATFC